MRNQALRPNLPLAIVAFTVLFGVMLACVRAIQPEDTNAFIAPPGQVGVQAEVLAGSSNKSLIPATRQPGAPALTPTPDPPRTLPPISTETRQYVVEVGDSLGQIAQEYGVSLQELIDANALENPDIVQPGQTLIIPPPSPDNPGPAFKIIPDSELVFGPASVNFDINAFVQGQGGYLAGYSEDVNGVVLTGAQIVQKISQNYSVNPRLLLAVLQYQSRWLTEANPSEGTLDYPVGLKDFSRQGLSKQLAWAANTLNHGFYIWRVNGLPTWVLADGTVVPIDPTINAGTAAVQNFFAQLYGLEDWKQILSDSGFITMYSALFGYPFDLGIEPLLPADLSQPSLRLPFEDGKTWAFTGGPHGGWDTGSAWAALDFAPPSEQLGCVKSDEWVTASADGQIIRTGEGQVIQDLDGDGFEQTGWVLLYMHVETRDRVQPQTFLKAGDRVGHPSCEGGVSDGTHVHFARKYNGEWIPADQNIPFVLDGWVSRGAGNAYDGYLERDSQSIEAFAGRGDNKIQR